MSGIPFLGPWIDRLDEQAFFANGKRHPFDMRSATSAARFPFTVSHADRSEWNVVGTQAAQTAAWVTSRLEFYRSRRG